ncbi:MAG: Protoheme IX farnesyltransferase [Alphaproteobacteria bacterium MarineAlpha4_Bin2]|nr:MAG: Protoheme IX farnesyltransferase [Alphaproteobacteria bacterium MarineAlpha4_Bin2]
MAHTATPSASATGDVIDYIALLKPRVMSLVVFTGFAGLAIAPVEIHPILAVVAVLCIALASGAAGAINMWYDRDIDAIMQRTCGRPLPTGKIDPSEALSFGVILGAGSVMLMFLATNVMAAGLLAAAILFYVFVYTVWLKRRTPQNIVIGGAAGAFPPVIGWAAATGDVGIEAAVLFFLIFFWTPPHFWALALYRKDDYLAAGVPMMPIARGAAATKRQMLAYTVVLIPLSLGPCLLGFAGWPIYGTTAMILNTVFLALAVMVVRDPTDRSARRMFGYSIFYLFGLFAVLVADNFIAGML